MGPLGGMIGPLFQEPLVRSNCANPARRAHSPQGRLNRDPDNEVSNRSKLPLPRALLVKPPRLLDRLNFHVLSTPIANQRSLPDDLEVTAQRLWLRPPGGTGTANELQYLILQGRDENPRHLCLLP